MRKHDYCLKITSVILFAWTLVYPLAPTLSYAQANDDRPCNTELAKCFVSDDGLPLAAFGEYGIPVTPGAPRMAAIYLRAAHGGPFAHHWLEVESSRGKVTIGFGPAIIPFVDFGEISIRDEEGNTQLVPALHLFSINYGYAKKPGAGHLIGEPIWLPMAEADALVEKARHRRFFTPYIPLFHDCRTFACVAQASARGHSTLPCYLLFKGYW
jgi:hypothetical protein